MSLPAADLPEPLAVLVLAWDEAAPAVRALVAATQAPAPTVDSILVMVPQANAPHHLSAEEYLPLALPELEEPAVAASAVEPAPTVPAPPLAEAPLPAPASTTLLQAEALEEDAEPATDELLLPGPPLAPTLATPPTPSLGWSAVRVLRLGSYSLPQVASLAGQPLPAPIWLGLTALPVAPYLGASQLSAAEPWQPASSPGPLLAADRPEASLFGAASQPSAVIVHQVAADASATAEPNAPQVKQPISAPPLTTEPAELPEAEPQEAALETDLPPSLADELESFELASPDLATVEDAPVLPEQAGWPEALAALRQPAAAATPEPEPVTAPPSEPAPAHETAATPAHAALRPPAASYSAPNLNFQIIQYARFAVPVALAAPAYEVIYAPAWPTWLAAQELRQRTGRPLVLHVAALAAPADESAETASGWVAELQRQALRRADLVLTETPALAERLHHELGLAAGTLRVVPAAATEAIAQALHEARPRPA